MRCRSPRWKWQSISEPRKSRAVAAAGAIAAHEALLLNSLRHLMCAVQPIQSSISGWMDQTATSEPSLPAAGSGSLWAHACTKPP